jgi:hypothetical protein
MMGHGGAHRGGGGEQWHSGGIPVGRGGNEAEERDEGGDRVIRRMLMR